MCIDGAQNITLFNASAEAMFGITAQQAIGRSLNTLIPERFHARHGGYVASFGKTGSSSRRMGQQRILLGLRANGEEFPIEASISRAQVSHLRGKSVADELVYSVILRDVTERVKSSRALEDAKDELQLLSRAAIQAREEEKTRISRELHDELGQKLTALKMDLGYLASSLATQATRQTSKTALDAQQLDALARMQALIDDTVANTRRIASNLRPLMLDDLGLCAALEWQVAQFLLRNPVQCALTIDASLDRLPADTATHVFRIVQEALNNIAKHSGATAVTISAYTTNDIVEINIGDNGVGIKPTGGKTGRDKTAHSKAGSQHGLLGIRERAYAQGGDMELSSPVQGGVMLRVHLKFALPQVVS